MRAPGTPIDLVTYLEELPPIKLERIYDSHWTCQAVLRSLPPIAKQYVLRLLFVTTPVSEGMFESWIQNSARSTHDASLAALQRLQILRSQSDRTGSIVHSLNPTFQEQLQGALCMRFDSHVSVPEAVLAQAPSSADILSYTTRQWEALLLYLLGDSKTLPSAPAYMGQLKLDIKELFETAGLLEPRSRAVTRAGFQFLLSDTYHQVWTLLRHYINSAENASGADLSTVIGFLLQLGFRSGPFSFQDIKSKEEQRLAADMVALGILCPFQGIDKRAYILPTALASSISAGGGSAGAKAAEGYIIVESNFKVYAYTSSQIRMKIIGLFVRLEVILPNLIVGTIVRESVISALASGISASQIVTYLRQHSSPHIADRTPVVPEVVADQIQLWENEQNRVRIQDACYFSSFDNKEIFEKSCKFAHETSAWLWQNSTKRQLVTTLDSYESMKKFIRANK